MSEETDETMRKIGMTKVGDEYRMYPDKDKCMECFNHPALRPNCKHCNGTGIEPTKIESFQDAIIEIEHIRTSLPILPKYERAAAEMILEFMGGQDKKLTDQKKLIEQLVDALTIIFNNTGDVFKSCRNANRALEAVKKAGY